MRDFCGLQVVSLMGKFYRILIFILMTLSVACSNQNFSIKQIAKTDVDMVADIVLLETREELKQLLIKLYKRNPDQLARAPGMTIERRLEMISLDTGRLYFAELNDLQEIAAMDLAFSDDYHGDRVFALMVGLIGMVRHAYNYDNDFFIFDELDAQVLYNSARNIEVMAWKLNNKLTPQGKPYLITSTYNGVVDNTSFERTYGKLINTQDIMAKIIADRDNRTINTVIKGTLSVFLPI
jgi:hypothetical protein